MTPDQLALIADMEAKARAATPGPWYVTGSPWFENASGVLAGSEDPHAGYMIADCEQFPGERSEYEGHLKLADADDDAAHIASSDPINVLTLITIIREQEAELANVGWQPIETAPKDGTRIMIYREGVIHIAKWIPGYETWGSSVERIPGETAPFTDLGEIGFYAMIAAHGPSHWRPLPAPPETTHAPR